MGDGQVLCGYCGDELASEASLDSHLEDCVKRPFWVGRRLGLEREGWDVPADDAA